MPPELALRVGPSIGKPLLRELPDTFIRVELGRIAGEVVEVQTGERAAQRPDRIPLVNGAAIPHEDDRSSQVAQQSTKEGADLGVLDVLGVEGVVQAEASSAGAHRQPGDHGDAIASLPVVQQRRLAARRPSLADAGNQEEARFVDEDEMGTQPRGFFLMRRHSSFFQRSIASSFRSSARRSGF